MASISSKIPRELASVLAAAAVALVTRSSLADHYVVPTGSMLPTVQLEDHVIVSKLAYGVHLPLVPGYVARFGGPARGDVVVLTAPDTGHRPAQARGGRPRRPGAGPRRARSR